LKRVKNGTTSVSKTRLVARGFEQQQDIDYKKTFAFVIKWNTLCFIISKDASKQWKTLQLDGKIAILCSLLEEMVVMKPPQGFKIKG
jgi:hypothetical protein